MTTFSLFITIQMCSFWFWIVVDCEGKFFWIGFVWWI